MTPIASLVDALLASGAAADVIVRAVEAAELQGQVRGKELTTSGPRRRGMRLPEDWHPSERCIAYALDRGMVRDRIAIEAEKFKNYWTAKTGASATKLNWEATWRNWIITAFGAGYRGRDGARRLHEAARHRQRRRYRAGLIPDDEIRRCVSPLPGVWRRSTGRRHSR
jgi:hypothetical protein